MKGRKSQKKRKKFRSEGTSMINLWTVPAGKQDSTENHNEFFSVCMKFQLSVMLKHNVYLLNDTRPFLYLKGGPAFQGLTRLRLRGFDG